MPQQPVVVVILFRQEIAPQGQFLAVKFSKLPHPRAFYPKKEEILK